jgi:hypothetical protein
VALAADDEVAGAAQSLLGRDDVGDAVAPLVVEAGDALLPHEAARRAEEARRGDVLGGHDVVEDHGDLLRIPDAARGDFPEDPDRTSRRQVVAHGHVDPRVDELAGLDGLLAAVGGQDLLGDRQAHGRADSYSAT